MEKKQIPIIVLLAVTIALNAALLFRAAESNRKTEALEREIEALRSNTDNYIRLVREDIWELQDQVRDSSTKVEDIEIEYAGLTGSGEVRTDISFTLKEHSGGEIVVRAEGEEGVFETSAVGDGLRRSCTLLLPYTDNYSIKITEKSGNGEVKLNDGRETGCNIAEMMDSRTFLASGSFGTGDGRVNGDMEIHNTTLGSEELSIKKAYLELYLEGALIYTEELYNVTNWDEVQRSRIMEAAGTSSAGAWATDSAEVYKYGSPQSDEAGIEILHYTFDVDVRDTDAPEDADFSAVRWQLRVEYGSGDTAVIEDAVGVAAG